MATKAKAAKGTLFQRGDGGGTEVFTTVAEVTSVGVPGLAVPDIDATSHDSGANEVIAGLPDGGELEMEMLFVGNNAQQQGLRSDLAAGTLRNFKVKLPDHATTPTTFSFSAIVKKWQPQAGGVNDPLKVNCTLRVSGLPAVSFAP